MYYMERGMWESNMALAFNFPDHNELQVEKGRSMFRASTSCSKRVSWTRRIFTFNIQNLATHYGRTDAAGDAVTTINLLEPGTITSEPKHFRDTVSTYRDEG